MANKTIEKTVSGNQPKWLVIFRIAVGLVLFWKGISFIHDSSVLAAMLQRTGIEILDKKAQTVAFIITYANLLGGLFIVAGLFTRWAAIVQIPILIGAIIFVSREAGMNLANSELILSVIVLLFLLVFAVKGSGMLSADEYFRDYYKAGYESGHTKKIFE